MCNILYAAFRAGGLEWEGEVGSGMGKGVDRLL